MLTGWYVTHSVFIFNVFNKKLKLSVYLYSLMQNDYLLIKELQLAVGLIKIT